MEGNENRTIELSPEIAATLFEPSPEDPKDETQEVAPEETEIIAPAPTEAKEEKEEDEEVLEITPDTILKHIVDEDEDGHSPSVIIVTLERLHNINEGTVMEEIPEEDREYVDDMVIEGASVDLYTLDGQLYNLILKFDTANDAFLKSLNEICNRYRAMREDDANEKASDPGLATLSVTIMPDTLKGYGALSLMFPVGYFRVLDDNGVNASMLLQFMDENVQFQSIDISSEMRSEITSDVMREAEEGNDGSLFE